MSITTRKMADEEDDDVQRPLLRKLSDCYHMRRTRGSRPRTNSEIEDVHSEGNYRISAVGTEFDSEAVKRKRWDLNYMEAAIYLQEGENNDKFTGHPRSQVDLPAYMITHNIWFHILMLGASLLLLSLAAFEEPAIDNISLPISVHATLELIGLLILTIELALKVKWLGFAVFVKHIRTMIKVVILIVMFVEAVVVICRQSSHIRVTRALRPIFLIDLHFCRGVRRFIRQIIQALPPIIDMLILVLFFILLFSTLGFYLFNDVPRDTYFQDYINSFISLFILLTTANFPDVMMPSYKNNRWSAIFFVIYISIELFLFMNLFLAVVYSAFIKIEKEKLRKLLLHRRAACDAAFRLLVSGQNPDAMSARHFAGCMKYFRPRMSKLEVYLVFKHLNVSTTGKLSLDEFMNVYNGTSLKWKEKPRDGLWSANFRSPLNRIFAAFNQLVTQKWFDFFIYGIIFTNFVWILVDTIRISIAKQQSDDPEHYNWFDDELHFLWISGIFLAIYIVEAILKILGLGPTKYFSSGWNTFDFIVTFVALIGLLLQLVNNRFYYIVLLRPLRVLRLFKMKRRFRDVFGTLFILFSRMLSLAVVMLLLFYFFAIIGMEVFASYTDQLMNCCRNTSVESFYMYNNKTDFDGYYYLNTFENILISGVTLFELTVVNNWWIIMEGFANVVSPWVRIYFMVFYLIIMVVMTVVVAFILEAFIFRIQYRQTMQGQDMDDHAIKRVYFTLSTPELEMCKASNSSFTSDHIPVQTNPDITPPGSNESSGPQQSTCFRGEKLLSKDDFSLRMYSAEVQEWIDEDKRKAQTTQQIHVQLQSSAAATIDSPPSTAVVV